jgi:hypothetical protein
MSIKATFSLSTAVLVTALGCHSIEDRAHADVGQATGDSRAAAAAAKATAPSPSPRSTRSPCDLREAHPEADCASSTCGQNSPVVNVFPYNGLHPDGCANPRGDTLVRGSVQKGYSRCDIKDTDKISLDIAPADRRSDSAGFELVGKDDDDHIRCSGADLVGATFSVQPAGPGRPVPLRISQMGTTAIGSHGTGPQSKRTVYLITRSDQPGRSLCVSPPPELAPPDGSSPGPFAPVLDNQSSKDGSLASVMDTELGGYAIVIPGAVYRADATLVDKSTEGNVAKGSKQSHHWFNLACTGDALAETELSGIATDPIVSPATAKARLPALHMFTAKYCDGVSGTIRGTPIAWSQGKRSSRARSRGQPIQSRTYTGSEPIEAQWGPDGATCVRHSRLWMANKSIGLPEQLLGNKHFRDIMQSKPYPVTEKDFLSRLCPQVPRTCGDPKKPDTLTSFPMDHIDDDD